MNTVILTGASSGLGRELALDFARRGWRLVLPVREENKAHDVLRFAASIGAPAPHVVECDLSDHVAVRDMCADVLNKGSVDVVINNAGVGGGMDPAVREVNGAGVEMRMAVNAVTPHIIAQELAPGLNAGGRIVQVGSMGQQELDLDDLNFEHDYDGIAAYCRSKVALVMSTMELAARGVPINVLHPANEMPTRMVREGGFPIASTLDDGALPVLRLALDTALSGTAGAYFHRFDRAEAHRQTREAASRQAVVEWMERVAQTG